jgi:hypothetical protein
MELDPQIALLAVVTMSVGYVMTVAGLAKNALEWRARGRRCPSCGRAIRAGACKCVGGAEG